MQVKQVPELRDYLEHLRQNPEEIQALFGDFLISVTTFFRDPAAFHAYFSELFPYVAHDDRSLWSTYRAVPTFPKLVPTSLAQYTISRSPRIPSATEG